MTARILTFYWSKDKLSVSHHRVFKLKESGFLRVASYDRIVDSSHLEKELRDLELAALNVAKPINGETLLNTVAFVLPD